MSAGLNVACRSGQMVTSLCSRYLNVPERIWQSHVRSGTFPTPVNAPIDSALSFAVSVTEGCRNKRRPWRSLPAKPSKVWGMVVLLAGVTVACSDSGPELNNAVHLEKQTPGDMQAATAGNRLSTPLGVKAKASDGSLVARARVSWEITAGNGAILSDTLTVSDGTGLAFVYLTLGANAGTYEVRATLAGRPGTAVTFTELAVAAPSIEAVLPDCFAGGDTITVFGTGLYDSVHVEVGGAVAKQVDATAEGRYLSVEVPSCRQPGPVQVLAAIGSAMSNAKTATYLASEVPMPLAVGEYMSIDPGATEACATVAAAGTNGAEYLLAVQWMGTSSGTLEFRLTSEPSPPPVIPSRSEQSPRSPAREFDSFLRGLERRLAAEPRSLLAGQRMEAAAYAAPVTVGARRTFRVCGTLSCTDPEDFPVVEAEAKYVGEHAVIYQDVTVPAGGFVQQDFEDLGKVFDEDLYGTATRAFGAESDVDGNDRVLILFTPWVNALTSKFGLQCAFSFVTGFFFSLDIDPLREQDERSNQAEVFYAMVPDPEGEVSCPHTLERVRKLVPVTFIHEFQHMVSFYQHVILRGGETEEPWLNEGLSHLAEELAGRHFGALGFDQKYDDYMTNNLTNSYRFLVEPSASAPAFATGVGTIEERGASWLFLSWLLDRYGDGLTRELSETRLTGGENLEAAVGQPMSRLLADWFLSNYVSDLPSFTPPTLLRRESWSLRDSYLWLHEAEPGRFPYPFPLRPPSFTSRAVDVSGNLSPGAGDMYRIVQSPGESAFEFFLSDLEGEPLRGNKLPWLSLIRLR